MSDNEERIQAPFDEDAYEEMLLLEELESALEDLEDGEPGLDAAAPEGEMMPEELRQRLSRLGIGSMSELRARIARLHEKLDKIDLEGGGRPADA